MPAIPTYVKPSGLTYAAPLMTRPTLPLAGRATRSIIFCEHTPSFSAMPFQIAEHTNRFLRIMPLMAPGSNTVDILVSPCAVLCRHPDAGGALVATRPDHAA